MPTRQFSRAARGALLVVSLVAALAAPGVARAQSGSTLTPDRLTYVVNKDVGSERWTINLNFASLDPPRAINVTGNVFRGATTPSFVWCQVRDDSTGTLDDPGSVFRLRCSGASACDVSATTCARTQWSLIADLVEIPASFFLPAGGNLTQSQAAQPARGALDLSSTTSAPALAAPAGGVGARGANLAPDGANFLVNKDLGGLRWSISLNQIPAQRGNVPVGDCVDGPECIINSRFVSVTGNVYPLDGSAPQFVWCQTRQESTGTLADPQSEFRFGCVGATACQTSASECAERSWQPIPGGADIRLQASFFLPPGGLPATPQSDPEIVVIGRTSDPPSIVVPLGQGATALDAATVQGGCSVGAGCTLAAGTCGAVQGRLVSDPALGCACLVEAIPPECIVCGGGATGVCGGDCQYQVGGSTARGQCLPFSSTGGECSCYAAGTSDAAAAPVSMCGGALGTECPSGKCCADDIRDGCNPADGDVDCAGICVDSNGCDPTVSTCGTCLDQRNEEPLVCGVIEAPPGSSCCEDCPDGSINCYCDPGRSCNLEADGGGCCPTSRPDLCNGSLCIPSGADCCFDCPAGVENCYCAAGSLCVLESDGGGCCPVDAPIRVPGAGCCPVDKPVGCGNLCLTEGSECCPDGESFCGPGTLCTADSQCVPSGPDDCGDGLFCEAGFQCVANEELECCRTDLTCDESCLTDGEQCCGEGFFCESGSVCVGGTGAAAQCCPEDRPVLCGDSCMPEGTVCDLAATSSGAQAASASSDASSTARQQSTVRSGDAAPRVGMRPGVPGVASEGPPVSSAGAVPQQ